jgi:hypothetical protein
LRIGAPRRQQAEGGLGRQEQEECMKKNWKKPTICQVAAGMEISRYLPAEIAPRR